MAINSKQSAEAAFFPFESECELNRVLAHNSDDTVLVVKASNSLALAEILFANDCSEQLTGYSADDLQLEPLSCLFGPKTDSRAIDELRQAFETNSKATMHVTCYRKDQSDFEAELRVVPWKSPVGEALFVLVKRDVSAYFRNELRRLEERSEERLQRLAAGLAHDFNNLLTTIVGFCELTKQTIDPENRDSDDEMLSYLGQIERASVGAGKICKQLLAYAGRKDHLHEPVDLQELVDEVIDITEQRGKPSYPIVRPASVALQNLIVDRHQLSAALQELLKHVLTQAEEIRSPVRVAMEHRRVFADDAHAAVLQSGEYVTVDLALAKIPVQQETWISRLDAYVDGCGLGFAAADRSIRSFGGLLSTIHEADRGVRIWMPQNLDESTSSTPSKADFCVDRKPVLIVEDRPDVQQMLQLTLARYQLDVQACQDGNSAMELLENAFDYELVILDVQLPGYSGIELLKSIRQSGIPLPVVLMSGFTQHNLAEIAEKDRYTKVLRKPFSIHDLEQHLIDLNILA